MQKSITHNNFQSFIPRIINKNGSKTNFNSSKLAKDLQNKTNIDSNTAFKIAKNVLKKIRKINLDDINTTIIKDLVCSELSALKLFKIRKEYLSKKEIRFVLSEEFIDKYKNQKPNLTPIGFITYKRTYSRFIAEYDRNEYFYETIRRNVEGCYSIQKIHFKKHNLPWNEDEMQIRAQNMFKKIWNFKFVPPGRGLWMMGTKYMYQHGSMALNNCGFVSTDDDKIEKSKIFQFVFDSLMLGVGIGFDTKGAGKIYIKGTKKETYKFKIVDSREGWTEALKILLDSYFKKQPRPIFDYSNIRSAGERIKGFGGITSGSDPLRSLFSEISELLDNKTSTFLTSVDIVFIMTRIAKCVVSGNVRRSALIALGNYDDINFITCKDTNNDFWSCNISVVINKNIDRIYLKKIIESIKINGEPGIVFLDNAKKFSRMSEPADYKDEEASGVNPCGEQTLESFELCCLVETFPSNHESEKEYIDTLEYAFEYAKSITLMNTQWDETNAVMLKNRRIGVSQSGIIDAFVKHGRLKILDWCRHGYTFLREYDRKLSNIFCVPVSKKITSIKPSGSVSLLANVSPGIHYPHSEYYIRRIRISENSKLLKSFKSANYEIEKDIASPNTMIIKIPIHVTIFNKSKKDVTIWQQIANAIDYQRVWSDNNVSITVSFKKEEEDQLEDAILFVRDKLKGITFMPLVDDKYPQMPYEEITKEQYESMISNIREINMFDKSTTKADGVIFCDTDSKHCK